AATISNSRGPESLASLIADIGGPITAGTTAEAASADIVVLAVRWADVEATLSGLPAWNGRILVDGTNPVLFLDPDSEDAKDTTNPLAAYGIKAVDLGGTGSTEIVAGFAPGARVVKAFNHLEVSLLAEPEVSGGKRVLFYAGDDAAAKSDVRDILDRAGFFPVDLGALSVGGPLAEPPFGALTGTSFIKI
ncbi:NADPH-dependent F420 reductase, partial [Tabrizicola sp.]|uniref:NADPH-dependent F420 reductase n=1 Tax=Tabrizicola sp. TaxID=2005166 RepID=UPI003F397FE3